jgi:hypothetical protein
MTSVYARHHAPDQRARTSERALTSEEADRYQALVGLLQATVVEQQNEIRQLKRAMHNLSIPCATTGHPNDASPSVHAPAQSRGHMATPTSHHQQQRHSHQDRRAFSVGISPLTNSLHASPESEEDDEARRHDDDIGPGGAGGAAGGGLSGAATATTATPSTASTGGDISTILGRAPTGSRPSVEGGPGTPTAVPASRSANPLRSLRLNPPAAIERDEGEGVASGCCPTCGAAGPSSPTNAAYRLPHEWHDVDRYVRDRMRTYAAALDEKLARSMAARVRRVTETHVAETAHRELQRYLQRAYYDEPHPDYDGLHGLAEGAGVSTTSQPPLRRGADRRKEPANHGRRAPSANKSQSRADGDQTPRHRRRHRRDHDRESRGAATPPDTSRSGSPRQREVEEEEAKPRRNHDRRGLGHATAEDLLAVPLPSSAMAVEAAIAKRHVEKYAARGRHAAAVEKIRELHDGTDTGRRRAQLDSLDRVFRHTVQHGRATRKRSERRRDEARETPDGKRVVTKFDEADERLTALEAALRAALSRPSTNAVDVSLASAAAGAYRHNQSNATEEPEAQTTPRFSPHPR